MNLPPNALLIWQIGMSIFLMLITISGISGYYDGYGKNR